MNRLYTKLFTGTHHDKVSFIHNPHKILGYLALIHYFTRYILFMAYGSMMFFNTYYDIFFFVGHLLLSCSSFLFPIREKRIESNVIIWRELQLHNIVFTLRSCSIMTLITLLPDSSVYLRFLIVICHHIIADVISMKVGQGNTMRDMKWDNHYIPDYVKPFIDKYYALAQFGAIIALIFSVNPIELGFMTMFSIQISAFLMTLRLKGIIKNDMFHILYTISLLMVISLGLLELKLTCVFVPIFFILRIVCKVNKYICLLLLLLLYTFLNNYNIVMYIYNEINQRF